MEIKKDMFQGNRWLILVMIVTLVTLVACSSSGVSASKEEPAIVEGIPGSEFNRVILTDKAAERLGITTETIREEMIDGVERMVIPYAAVIYGLNGETWAYINTDLLTYTRAPITIETIEGDKVYLLDGPPVGTEVVTVGVAELYGTDTGIGK